MVTPHRASATLTPGPQVDPQATILALASPPGQGARAILRLSGNDLAVFLQDAGLTAFDPAIRRSHFPLRVPGLSYPIPLEILSWSGPHSYTGQDVVELHLLGSPPLVQAAMEHLLSMGARLAQPGEFTLRAFLAGKLDLTQVEAVHGLITATNSDELRTALAQLAGGLARPLEKVREEILHLLAELEASLDFAEEDLSFIGQEELARRLTRCLAQVTDCLRLLNQRRHADRPFRVVLLGRPNAGKSSLLNALTGQELALVSPQAGTTRDYVTVSIRIDNIAMELIDTAGVEATSTLRDEQITIQTQAQAARVEMTAQADLLLLCVDCQTEMPVELRGWLNVPTPPVLPLWTKADLPHRIETQPESNWLRTSVTTGVGLDTLRTRLAELARSHHHGSSIAPSVTRCRTHLEACREHLHEAQHLAQSQAYAELLALELRLALEELGYVVGAVYTEDLLDRVFSEFCIGK